MKATLARLFPFVAWFPVSAVVLRADLLAGATGALVLVPKAMAYAQLSGLPVHYGLYVALVPAVIGALWGSSRQLATGPVAVVSLMTAAALAPLAVPFSDDYVGLAILLALLVGLIQLGLGVLKLGVIVNFISHPVILGFMNAAAIIIALSQLDQLLGIPKGRSGSFLMDVWEMLGYLRQTHLPTLAMSAFAIALMIGLRRIGPISKTSVLIAVAVTTLASAAIGYEHKAEGRIEEIATPGARELVAAYSRADAQTRQLAAEAAAKSTLWRAAANSGDAHAAAVLRHEIELLRLNADGLSAGNRARLTDINRLAFERVEAAPRAPAQWHVAGTAPQGAQTDGRQWRVKKIEGSALHLSGGGEVVGHIPAGLPSFRVPRLDFDAVAALLAAALVIALVGFMESISMAKAMATQSKQKIAPNQELIGQGLANIGGAFFQSYPACGSFTGSAINLQAGAKTGFAMVFNSAFVALTLLFLTGFLYHLPKAVLAVVVVFAVASLITPAALRHTWKASRSDGIVALVTFAVTLFAAPHLDRGIVAGAALALGLFLYGTMKPRVALLGRHADGTLRDAKLHALPTSKLVTVVRFDGRLYFANVAYFEDAVMDAVADNPGARYVLIVGDGINSMDASGDEALHRMVERLKAAGTVVAFAGLKKQVLDVMRATGLYEFVGVDRFHASAEHALEAIFARPEHAGADDPLRPRARR